MREPMQSRRDKLNRTGHAPVMRGQEIARVYGRWGHGVEQDRYHNLAVYRTDGGQSVCSIQYHTQSPDEQPHDRAVLGQDAHAFDPTRAIVDAFPSDSEYVPL